MKVLLGIDVLEDDFRAENDLLVEAVLHDHTVLVSLRAHPHLQHLPLNRIRCLLVLIMDLERPSRQHLEKRFAVIVDELETLVSHVRHVAISEPFRHKQSPFEIVKATVDPDNLPVTQHHRFPYLIVHFNLYI